MARSPVVVDAYARCDDGYIAEGVSAFVTETLSKKWNTVDNLDAETRSRPAFRRFVLNHVDATAIPTTYEASKRSRTAIARAG